MPPSLLLGWTWKWFAHPNGTIGNREENWQVGKNIFEKDTKTFRETVGAKIRRRLSKLVLFKIMSMSGESALFMVYNVAMQLKRLVNWNLPSRQKSTRQNRTFMLCWRYCYVGGMAMHPLKVVFRPTDAEVVSSIAGRYVGIWAETKGGLKAAWRKAEEKPVDGVLQVLIASRNWWVWCNAKFLMLVLGTPWICS